MASEMMQTQMEAMPEQSNGLIDMISSLAEQIKGTIGTNGANIAA